MKWIVYATVLATLASWILTQETDVCKCVAYYLCENGTIVQDGSDLIGERFGGTCKCDCPANVVPQVCCFLNNTPPTTETATPIVQVTTKPTTEIPTSMTPGIRGNIPCGKRNPDGVGYKSATSPSEDSNFGEFPWSVDILDENGAQRCSGSLIHPAVILTAAHCVTKSKTYIVRAGDWDNSNTDELLKHQELQASSVKIHEDYNPSVHYNDAALLFLAGSFHLAEHIRPACLARADAQIGGDRCYVSGRGKDGTGQYRPILKKVDLPIVEKGRCQDDLKKTNKLGQYFKLHSSFICAGGEANKDSCTGDGGAALVCPIGGEQERYQQVGIASWGVGCNQENVPGVYANVKALRNWIDREMAAKFIDSHYYTL